MENTLDFTKLYEEIYRLLPGRNIQALMDICYEIVGVPILTVDILYNVLGISPNSPTGDYMWDYLLEHKGYETDMVANLYEDGIIQSVDNQKAPYIVDWGSCKDRPKIQGIVKVNNIVEGYVTMNCSYEDLTPDRMKAMDIIMNICSFFFSENRSESSLHHTYQKVFASELFNNRIKTQIQLITWFKDMGCELPGPYQITAISTLDKKEKNVLSYIYKSIQLHSTSQIMLIQNNILYVLFYHYKGKSGLNETVLSLKSTLHKFRAQCGISNTFHHLLDISSYQIQAEDAMNLGGLLDPDKLIHSYHNYLLPAILLPRVKEMPKCNYLPHVIEEIRQYDTANSTALLNTLKCYIHHLQNTLETAKTLHIHRNTLLYRIHKIEELFDLKLDDYQTFMYFMLVFYMIDLEEKL